MAFYIDSFLAGLEDIDFGLNIETDKAREVHELLENF